MYLIRRKNGTYYAQFIDPNTNLKRRISTGTKSKKEALIFLRNFEPVKEKKGDYLKLSRFRDEYLLTNAPGRLRDLCID